MITEKEMIRRLYELPGMFLHYMKNKQWGSAKDCYNKALTVCTFMEVDDKVKIELFGNRAYIDDGEKVIDGLFREEDVLKMLSECSTAEEREIKLIRMRQEVNRRQKKNRFGERSSGTR